jgi:peptidoglycan hydrolase-like protein with peptidoglycan-binding domain
MASSANQRRKGRRRGGALIYNGAVAVGEIISRNPVLVGGTTAFLVALSFVSANALWYQPHFHQGAFFSTRNLGERYIAPRLEDDMPGLTGDSPETTIRLEREPAPAPKPDPEVMEIQEGLRELGFYSGPVDGIEGPHTRSAIESYQKTVGLPISGEIDEELLDQLGTKSTAAITPQPAPRQADGKPGEPAARMGPDPFIAKIQAGLKAFGNDGIEVDGVMGARTKSAIEEFQSLFGLPVTGQPEEAVYAKMREIGLTN